MGLDVLGPDVNESYYKFAVNKENQIRFGMGAIKGVGRSAVETIVDTYLKVRSNPSEEFLATWRRLGAAPFKEALYANAGH